MSRVSKLVVGTANFGENYGFINEKVSPNTLNHIMKICDKYGINTFDTSQLYYNSELALGRYSKLELDIISKFTIQNLSKLETMQNCIENTLSKLCQKQLYGFLFHRSSDLDTPIGKRCLRELFALKENGVVKKIGVSVYSPDEIYRVLDVFTPDLIQFPFNVFDQRMLYSDVIATLKELCVELHGRSVFLQGLLLTKIETLPEQFKEWSGSFYKFEEICNKHRCTKLRLCLEFVLGQTWIDKVVLGVNSSEQLKMLIDIANQQEILLNCQTLALDDTRLLSPANWNKT